MDKVITIRVELNSTIEKAWDFWTNPEHIVHWNFASENWHCPSAVNDTKEGGKFSWRMEAKDGSFGFDFMGVYTKVVPQKLLQYGLGDGRPVSVQFEQIDDKIIVSETFQGEDVNTLERQREGWQCILNNYKLYVEK